MSIEMSLSSKQMDVLLHLELQKSAKIRADIEKELEDVVSIMDAFEMYKAKGRTVTPSLSSMFTLLNRLKTIDMGDS
jgi:hypothetical protein